LGGHITSVIIELNLYIRFRVDAYYYNTTYSDLSFGTLSNAFSDVKKNLHKVNFLVGGASEARAEK
jgi:hypothetical protein